MAEGKYIFLIINTSFNPKKVQFISQKLYITSLLPLYFSLNVPVRLVGNTCDSLATPN